MFYNCTKLGYYGPIFILQLSFGREMILSRNRVINRCNYLVLRPKALKLHTLYCVRFGFFCVCWTGQVCCFLLGPMSCCLNTSNYEYSNYGCRLAEGKRLRLRRWTVGPTQDGIFVQKAICRKTPVYLPPPSHSEGADTSCPSTPTGLSARGTPSLLLQARGGAEEDNRGL